MPEQEYDTTLPEEVAAETAPGLENQETAPEAAAAEAAAPEAEAEVGNPNTPTFTVTVDGETFEVSAEEAIRGYQRQADYTRKTQEVAREREALAPAQQLWEAIENNPHQTVAALAAAYGFTLTPQQEAAAEAQRTQRDPFDDLLEEPPASPAPDPRWEQVERFMQTQAQREQQAAVEAELAQVTAKYGVNVDPQALIEYALENDIGNLDAAFRAMSFEAAQQAAVRARKAGRKQELPPVAGGHPVQAGVLAPGAGSKFPSLEESFAAALAEAEG